MSYFNNFTCKEFFPNCSKDEIVECINEGFFDKVLFLFNILDNFRDFIHFPIVVTSSFRSAEHNKSVGGSPTSQHMSGSAIDFKCDSISFDALILLLDDFFKKSAFETFIGQVIYYHERKFIHLALRTPRYKSLTKIHYEQRDN